MKNMIYINLSLEDDYQQQKVKNSQSLEGKLKQRKINKNINQRKNNLHPQSKKAQINSHNYK